MNQDLLHRYLFDNADVRGELVQLNKTYQQITQTHNYPTRVSLLLGELLAATTLLTATLKFDGDISVQLQGQGGLMSLAVINGNNKQQLRGVARWDGQINDDAKLTDLFGTQGYMVITLTPDEGERYQGVVALDKPSIAECLEGYFTQSEQLPTTIRLFANENQATGILLQALPSETENNDTYDHLEQLTATIKAQELYELPATEVLHRLYHQEEVRLFDPVEVSFKCTCSRERSAAAIRSLPKEEIDSIISEKGKVAMDCEYCNSHYSFDAIDVEGIYMDHQQAPNTKM